MKVWDLREGRLFYTLFGHEGATLGLNFSPAGDFFASGGADGQVMVWKTNFDRDLSEFTIVPAPEKHSAVVNKSERLPVAVQEDKELHKKVSGKHTGDSLGFDQWVENAPEQKFHDQNLLSDHQTPAPSDNGPKSSCRGTDRNEVFPRHAIPNSGVETCKRECSGAEYTLDEILGEVNGNNVKLPAPLDLGSIPQPLAATLQHVIGELNVISQTLGMVVERLTINEDRVRRLEQGLGNAASGAIQDVEKK